MVLDCFVAEPVLVIVQPDGSSKPQIWAIVSASLETPTFSSTCESAADPKHPGIAQSSNPIANIRTVRENSL